MLMLFLQIMTDRSARCIGLEGQAVPYAAARRIFCVVSLEAVARHCESSPHHGKGAPSALPRRSGYLAGGDGPSCSNRGASSRFDDEVALRVLILTPRDAVALRATEAGLPRRAGDDVFRRGRKEECWRSYRIPRRGRFRVMSKARCEKPRGDCNNVSKGRQAACFARNNRAPGARSMVGLVVAAGVRPRPDGDDIGQGRRNTTRSASLP